ncbi:MAG TPA: M28 family peptidase [Bacteroidales bacterium]|nr:M28 family peptidase [Bacteroidales bacterium]HPT21447.1 M28 family peptidase [Bacteroidales bacterium]
MQKFRLILILLLVQFTGFSQDLDYAGNIIKKLASPEFKGRGYVENGDKKSADFISSEFRNLGLTPVTKKSYYQKFNIAVNTFPKRVFFRIDENELVAGSDFIIESSSPSVNGKFRIVKTSRSQLDTEAKLESLIKNADGSFILIDSRDKKNEKPEVSKQTDENINFLKHDPQLNIKGIIIYTSDKLTWEISSKQNPRPVITLIKELDINSVASVELTIDAKFLPNYTTQNVIGSIKGTSKPDSMIVVLAHYDHLGKMGKDTYFPGANDNASGVAMILNLAKYYSKNKPEYTMVFVALSAEELGILGARAFADNPPVDLKKIKFLVNFDLAGTGEEGVRVVNGSVFRDKFDLLTRINEEQLLLPKIDIRGAACNSDHCPFYQKGVPCFYIYTQGGIKAYHDIYDKSETLPLTEFIDYYRLMIEFFSKI